MYYISTRGQAQPKSFKDILLEGLAPDGGLYMPEAYPSCNFEALQGRPYYEMAALIFRRFAPDISLEDWMELTSKTYTAQQFGSARVAPLLWVEPGLGLLQLSNGPTLAFKDMALQLLGNLMDHVLEERNEELNILGATSGDTGSAAEYALIGKSRMRCFMLSPYGRMSEFQQRQMYTLDYPGIHNLVVNGTFDDCQRVMKEVNADADFKKRYKLGAVNSTNWARIMAQAAYWIWAYLNAPKSSNGRVTFSVPSGNFGNAFSAYVAAKMGVPTDVVVATNENYVLHEFFGMSMGQYRVRKGSEVKATSSPSMDIAEASNFERYIFDMVGRDPTRVRELWDSLRLSGTFTLAGSEMERIAKSGIRSGMATEHEVLDTIRLIEKYGVIIDPHTAVGMKVGLEYREPKVPLIVAETAKAAKFPETIKKAIGRSPPVPIAYEELANLPQKTHRIDPDAEVVKKFIAAHV